MKRHLGYKTNFYLFAFFLPAMITIATLVVWLSATTVMQYCISGFLFLFLLYNIYIFARNIPIRVEYSDTELVVKFLISKYNRKVKLTDIKDIIYPGKGYMSMFGRKLPDEAILIQCNDEIIPLWLKYYSGLDKLYTLWLNKSEPNHSYPQKEEMHIEKHTFKLSVFSCYETYLLGFGLLILINIISLCYSRNCSFFIWVFAFAIYGIIFYGIGRPLLYIVLENNKLILKHGIFPFLSKSFTLNNIHKIIFLKTYADCTIQICTNDFKIKEYKINLVSEKNIPEIINLLKNSGIILINDLDKGIL